MSSSAGRIPYRELSRALSVAIKPTFSEKSRNLIRWISYYVCFCKSAALVSGLVFSHKLVEFAILRVLITYFTDVSSENKYDFKKAAVFTNIQEGLPATLVIFATWISYSPIRPIKVIICTSTASYTIALVLLFFTASGYFRESRIDLFNIIGMILLAVGEAGLEPLLGAFLSDQIKKHGERENRDQNQVMAQRRVWWTLAASCSVGVAILVSNLSLWADTFKWTGVVVGSSLTLFLLGIRSYHSRELNFVDDPFAVFRVVKASLKKRHVPYPSSPHQFYCNDENQLYLSPRIKCLRRLDKAAIIESSSNPSPETGSKPCTVKQVRESKLLFKMLPMWTSFLVFGLALSAGDTFFPEQGTDMRHENFITLMLIFKPILKETVSFLLNLLISRCSGNTKQRQLQLVRIFMGMVISTFCCAVAWKVEVHRLKPSPVQMSIFWLVPQFCMLGLMEGLAAKGLDELLTHYFPDWTEENVSAINQFVIKIGSFLNISFVYANKNLFGRTLDDSRLDKYFMRLTVVSSVNVCYNLCVSFLYIKGERSRGNERSQATNKEMYLRSTSSSAAYSPNERESTTRGNARLTMSRSV